MSSIDFSKLSVQKVIIHEVERQPLHGNKRPPVFSEGLSSLDDDLRLFLKDRISNNLSRDNSFEVLFLDTMPSFAANILNRFLQNPDDFIQISKDVATQLNRVQKGNSPTGLLTFIEIAVGNKKGIAILKLELEEGGRILQTEVEGKLTFDLSHLRDLILTDKTKLFKIALFLEDCRSLHGFDGKVCDNQLVSQQKQDVAFFFLETFLGCKVSGDPKAETKAFFYAAQEFFNDEVEDPVVSSSYGIHLLSYLTQERNTISPRQFANEHLAVAHRDPFVKYLEKKGVRSRGFSRNTSLIEQHLKDLVVEFENGVKISGKKENFKDAVKLTSQKNGTTKAEVVSKVKSVRS